ncbi:MAG: ABC transporter substrate-binding protein [Lachnospiraceae bacterium]|nr:ABC transporter substrate-binding protein [Lachnospiraceae bacterium]
MVSNMKKLLKVLLAAVLALTLTACSAAGNAVADTVNVGVTSPVGLLNPLKMDGVEINKYATGLMFLPLVEIDPELNFVGQLADSITTTDNLNFDVHIDETAVWSDGQPITAEDVAYTVLRMASPSIGNVTMQLYNIVGVKDDGMVEAGADSIEGVQVIDEKTVRFTTKFPMGLTSFQNAYGRYIMTLPKHIIEQFSEEELPTAEWFNQPDVVSGPYFVSDVDFNHYVSYQANEQYWRGAPSIKNLNIRIVDGSQLYAGLQSGEIDITHHTLSSIPQEDYESVEELDNIKVIYGTPVTNLSVFIQTANVPDVRVRQALLYAIDREKILSDLLKGKGEIVDGFLSSAGPFYDETMVPFAYDPDKARALLTDAGWDGTQVLTMYIDSGDSTFVNAAAVMVAQWAEIGITVEIRSVDLNTLMTVPTDESTSDYAMMAVQYTYPPIDPYADVFWLLGGPGSWTGYSDPAIDAALVDVQNSSDTQAVKELYSIINRKVQEDVPLFSAYVISPQGAVNNRLLNAEPSAYGFFNEVQNWEIAQ